MGIVIRQENSGTVVKLYQAKNDFNPEKYDQYNSNYYNQYGYYENAEERKPLWKRWFKL